MTEYQKIAAEVISRLAAERDALLRERGEEERIALRLTRERNEYMESLVAERDAALARVRVLTEALEKAPHTENCSSRYLFCGSCGSSPNSCRCGAHYTGEAYESRDCDCWKAALAAPQDPTPSQSLHEENRRLREGLEGIVAGAKRRFAQDRPSDEDLARVGIYFGPGNNSLEVQAHDSGARLAWAAASKLARAALSAPAQERQATV